MRILVVEDEPDLADAVAAGLRGDGYAVDVAPDAGRARARLAVTDYDLVCLDLNLPDGDGLALCRELADRPAGPTPPPRVLVLTARASLADRVAGLDSGADDYLVKPFALAELTARVRALSRRETRSGSATLRVGDIELDAARHEVRRGGALVDLTAKERALLRYLMLHAGEVHSAERLLEHVWDEHADPFTNTVRVTISNLRRKLAGGDGRQVIETVVGEGYRLRADVDP